MVTRQSVDRMRCARAITWIIVAGLLSIWQPSASRAAAPQDRFFTSSDGVRLHYIEAGPTKARSIVLVPGWTMPAWIFERQIADLSAQFHVIAFDPRGQGDSAVPSSGYEHNRRGADIGDLLTHLGGEPVLLVAWSLGVLDSLAYMQNAGDRRIAGLVLVDNSIGEEPPPTPPKPRPPGPKLTWAQDMQRFVRTMFAKAPAPAWLNRLTTDCLRMPEAAAKALLAYPVPRSYWKGAVYATSRPVLYIVRPKFAGQASNLAAHHPTAESVVLNDLGHALFVDDAPRFNRMIRDFAARKVWPRA